MEYWNDGKYWNSGTMVFPKKSGNFPKRREGKGSSKGTEGVNSP
jgi:hypothetical protein